MNTLSKPHEEVLKTIKSKLEEEGFQVIEYTYHETLKNSEKKTLKNCFTFECLFIRAMPDILAIKKGKSIFIEAKSKSTKYPNLAIELLPFMIYYYFEKIGLNIFYVYGAKNEKGEIELFYFRPSDVINLISHVYITEKLDKQINEKLEKFSREKLNREPKKKPKVISRKSEIENVGSNDPFIVIKKEELSRLKRLKSFDSLL